MDRYNDVIREIWESIERNKNSEIRGIPISGAIVDEEDNVVDITNNIKSDEITDENTHAEHLLINRFKPEEGKVYKIFTSLKPCKKCAILIEKTKWIGEVIYIQEIERSNNDVYRKTKIRKYIENDDTFQLVHLICENFNRFLKKSKRHKEANRRRKTLRQQ